MLTLRHMPKLLLALVILLPVVISGAPITAQDAGGVCPALAETVTTIAADACGDLVPGEVCYGFADAAVALREGEATFIMPGNTVNLAAVQSLTTGGADPAGQQWGVAVLKTRADLPEASDQSITMILFGDAELTSVVDPNTGDVPTITLQNVAGYPINLRSGAGTNYAVVAALDNNAQVIADGRNADATSGAGVWYRVLSDAGPAWVFGSLVTVADGDPATLVERAIDDVLLAYSAPMQAFTLTTAPDAGACGAGSSGLFIQADGEATAHMQVNGIDISFASATLLVQAPTEAMTQLIVLSGSVGVSYNGIGASAGEGARVEVEYANEAGPFVHQSYRFLEVDGALLDLLPAPAACTTGVLAAEDDVTLYYGPGEAYGTLAPMDPELHYTVTGQYVDEDGVLWWRLDIRGYAQGWVMQDAVQTVGTCAEVAEVGAPSLVSNPGGGGAASGLVPAGQSVWQANPGLDQMSGTCNGPALAFCAHLVAIEPYPDGSLSWRGQEMIPYTMQAAGNNTYVYNGRNQINNGTLSLTLTFTSESTWSMTYIATLDSDPACQHTFYYTATRSW
ncbi:MAG: SH3 domain-containing protein [Anaerolineae bacterium]|nr:SH3 domain-containing protein [Anaerolineae bacterium]